MSEHPARRAVGLALLALAGLAIAVVLSVAASNLSTQPIGLLGEPLRAGDKLAPAPSDTPSTHRGQGRPRSTTTQTATIPTQTTPTQTATTPADSAGTPGSRTDDHGGGDPDHDDD